MQVNTCWKALASSSATVEKGVVVLVGEAHEARVPFRRRHAAGRLARPPVPLGAVVATLRSLGQWLPFAENRAYSRILRCHLLRRILSRLIQMLHRISSISFVEEIRRGIVAI